MNFFSSVRAFVAAAVLSAAAQAQPADQAELEALRAQVRQLEQQLNAIKRQLDAREHVAASSATISPSSGTNAIAKTNEASASAAAAGAGSSAQGNAASPAAKITLNDKGFTFASADGANVLKVGGLVQFDSRLFFGDDGLTNNAFVLRRARLIAQGGFAKNYSYQLVTEYGGSTVSILDANFTVALSPAAQIKFGKFKMPIGLERTQSDSWTFFDERSLVTNLTPDRDLGVQISGDLAKGVVSYAAGVFNGVADANATNNSDFDNEKEVAARVMVSPFKTAAKSPLRGFSFGVGGSEGREKSAAGRAAAYRTDGQQTFFTYNSAVIADGRTWRLSPQADFRSGPFGLLGEYIVSAVNLRPSAGAPKTELRHRAWQLATGYVITGEDSSYTGVTPKTNFDWAAGTWGAFEAVGRFADLEIDDAAFPAFASPGTSANSAKSVGLGLNWYLSKVVRFSFDYYRTNFGLNALVTGVPASPLLRQDEKAFVSRFQLSF